MVSERRTNMYETVFLPAIPGDGGSVREGTGGV
jgi:hypothetical protein